MSDGGFGFGGGPGLDPITGWLTGAIEGIIAALEYIWNVLVAIAKWLYNAIVIMAKFIAAHIWLALKHLEHLLKKFYPDVIKPLISHIKNVVATIRGIIGAYVDIIKRVMAWYNKYIYKYQKLALQIVSATRVAIELFKLLGAQWAIKLDKTLQIIQSYITQSILDVVQTLNAVTNWLNIIADPTAVIRKQFWSSTVFTGFGEIFKAANMGGMRPITPAEKLQEQQNLSLMDPAAKNVTLAPDGTAQLSPPMQDMFSKMHEAEKLYNPTVPGYTGPVQQ
jgi:hypothetical protein